ncbi:MAG: radical SAM protein [Deltaproteobacteria bacterium]|nr:radical SAM protein [Deltaproteobacteria bacterium]
MVFSTYLELWAAGELQERTQRAAHILKSCSLCPRRCGVDRTRGERGFCRSGMLPMVSSYNVHPGEEPPISGTRGSGTIFLTHCNLRCVFCQNYPISQLGVGREKSAEGLAQMMLDLQKRGCHNINWVTPTHFVPQILEAICLAIARGFRLPFVYNTNGYDSLETLRLLDGIVDIYLPDMKYADEDTARAYSQAPSYPEVNAAAVQEMYRQVGEGRYGQDGTMERGLIIRHLLLPHGLAGTENMARFVARNLSRQCPISLMTQFFPAYRAKDFPKLRRRLHRWELEEALEILGRYRLQRGWMQEQM